MSGRVVAGSVALVAAAVPIPAASQSPNDVPEVILGVDLSYVNEIEDCGATYTDGTSDDPFVILAAHGANLVRARLWHDPDWTEYSTTDDVIRTFERAAANGMRTLLDFHYSDEWADPGRQNPPAAWAALTDVDDVAAALGDYTTDTLERLDAAGVLPDVVQIGNEINSGLVNGAVGLDWDHELPLLEAGIAAVRSVSEATGQPIDVMLHVAQPENALDWFAQAADVGLVDFDVIGLSYYPQWSRFSPAELGSAVQSLASGYGKEVLVVETAYPWTHDDAGDTADNVLDQALRAYHVSPVGQAAFMSDLTAIVVANGGAGTVYWEPAWLSTGCDTRWGQGSHWENATLFDFDGALHAGAGYLTRDYDPLAPPDADAIAVGDDHGDTDDADADLTQLTAAHDGRRAQIAVTIAGDVRRWPGALLVAFDTADGGGDGGRRPYAFAADDRPELLVESAWSDDPGLGYVSTTLALWADGGWQPRTFTGRVVVATQPDGSTTVTWTFPDGSIDPDAALTAMTARRGRAGALADAIDPSTPGTPVAMALDLGAD